MRLGQRVENPMTYREGTVVSQPYVADNAMYLVVDVRWDNGNRSTIQASKLRPIQGDVNPADDDAPTCRDCQTWPCSRHATEQDIAEYAARTGS